MGFAGFTLAAWFRRMKGSRRRGAGRDGDSALQPQNESPRDQSAVAGRRM